MEDAGVGAGSASDKDVSIVLEHPPPDNAEMVDYDVADENQWDIE
jgi:hypothetical protein